MSVKKKYEVTLVKTYQYRECEYFGPPTVIERKETFETWAVSEKQAINNVSFRTGKREGWYEALGRDSYVEYHYTLQEGGQC